MEHQTLPRCTPESQGVASAAILNFVQAVEENVHEMHSFMLLRRGAVIAEGWWAPYRHKYPHMLFSLSKSFTAAAVGLAEAEGLLHLDDPVLRFFPDQAPNAPGEFLRALRIRQLLSMSTGHAIDPTGDVFGGANPDWVQAFLALPPDFLPGLHFTYNTAATFMLAAIVEKVTGLGLVDYLEPRLFRPLGIDRPIWDESPLGTAVGGTGLNLKTEDIARFGQMYLQNGRWNGQQILPQAWVAEASARQVSNGPDPNSDWNQGYGYQFWRCRHSAYRGDGAFGQYCVVMPEQQAVLAITSGLNDMQVVLDIAWDCLLPAMASAAPQPADPAAQAALTEKLAGLALPLPQGHSTSAAAADVSGRRWQMDANTPGIESLTFTFSPAGCQIAIEKTGLVQPISISFMGEIARSGAITCGAGAWNTGATGVFLGGERLVAAAGAWIAQDTYHAVLRLVNTPFVLHLDARFAGATVNVTLRQNVSFAPELEHTLVGRLAA